MVSRRLKRHLVTLLWLINAVLGVGVIWLAIPSSPGQSIDLPTVASIHADSEAPVLTGPQLLELSNYRPLWERDLRQPPIPPEPKPAVAPTRPPPQELPRLVGTFIDAETAYGHFETRDGRLRVRSLEDDLEGYQVAAVEQGRAKLTLGAKEYWIEVPRPD